MRTAQQLQLFDQLSFYEGADVEYKSARGGLPRSLWETYSAFANTEGGTLWLGVVQKSDRLDVQGIPQAEKLVTDLWNLANNREKISRNLLKESDVQVISTEVPGHALIRIQVPRANRRERPVYVGTDPLRGTYRRNFEGDYQCREDEVRRMFGDQSDEPADSRVLEGFGWEDLHPESLRQFRNRFASARPGHPWLGEDDKELLARLGGWRRDRLARTEGITVAGLLMFGREQAIRDPAAIAGFHLDYREHFSDDSNIRWSDRLTLDGSWEGNLFQFYQRVMLKISSGPGIKHPFQTDAEGYRRAYGPVAEALQEALVNALIHADYAGQGGIVIDRYTDRLAFSNPGSLLVSREQLRQGGVSECRNKSLQQMFQMLGAGDKAGSGIDRIMSNWAAQHWQAPVLRETQQPDRVVLDLPMVSVLPDGILDELRGHFGPGFDTLSADEAQALITARIEGQVTNGRLQDMLTRHRVDITAMLRDLVQRQMLVSDGIGRGTRYLLPYTPVEPSLPEDSAPPLTGGASPLASPAPPLAGSASALGSPQPTPPRPAAITGDTESDRRLLALAEPVRAQQRTSPERMRSVIESICAVQFLTLKQMGVLLNRRSKDKLYGNYVKPMVDAGILELRYPDKPNHQDQAYRSRNAPAVGLDA